MLETFKKYATNKTIVHLAMLAFAITSTLNIAGFFLATHHHFLVASSIGLALIAAQRLSVNGHIEVLNAI